jgi:hypothetical protein
MLAVALMASVANVLIELLGIFPVAISPPTAWNRFLFLLDLEAKRSLAELPDQTAIRYKHRPNPIVNLN